MKNYIKNLETGKIELHFEKAEYVALTAEQKKELKRHYLWSRTVNVWVSRGINYQYQAIETAKKLGFTEGETVGERLSYEEQLNRKSEKAERRAERFEQYAENAEHRAENLQAELKSFHGDIAFFTQPIIRGHAGSEAFAKRRQRIFDRYGKGFEEYRKSEYFKERAITAQNTAEQTQLKNPVYLNNRIKESNSTIKKLQGNIVYYEQILYNKENNLPVSAFYESKTPEQVNEWLENTLEKIEWEMDKLAFLQNCFDEVGGNTYSKENIKEGYLVKIRGHWDKVLKANKTTVETIVVEGGAKGFIMKHPYAEIQEMKIPEGWTEPKAITPENPFQVGDIVTKNRPADNSPYRAYQVTKTTSKTITIRRIDIKDNKPCQGVFVSEKEERKTVKKDRQGNFVVNDNDWYLYKYTA